MPTAWKNLFLISKNPSRSSFLWNAVAGTSSAIQSAFLLIVIMRTNGIDDAGVFSIAYAIARMMFYIAEFGVRKYQVSDVNEVNSFSDYYTYRVFSCTAMFLASGAYAGYAALSRGYALSKFIIIMLICTVILVEGFVDVFHGRMQQKNHLDVASKTDSFRLIFGMLCCTAALIITRNLLISCIVWVLSVILGMFISTLLVAPQFCDRRFRIRREALKRIFIDCLPLFLGSFLLLYLGNAPKYAIDIYMDDSSQACFNFIFMPVFVIGMFASFIYNPLLARMSIEWDRGHYRVFNSIIWKQVGIIAALTALAMAVALTIGCPVLGMIYNTDLSMYRMDLCILMIGGGMWALVLFFTISVTIIRYQKHLTAGYLLTALIALLFSGRLVAARGILGASILYTALMSLLALIFAAVLFFSQRHARKRRSEISQDPTA